MRFNKSCGTSGHIGTGQKGPGGKGPSRKKHKKAVQHHAANQTIVSELAAENRQFLLRLHKDKVDKEYIHAIWGLLETVETGEIDREEFRGIVGMSPEMARSFVDTMVGRMRVEYAVYDLRVEELKAKWDRERSGAGR